MNLGDAPSSTITPSHTDGTGCGGASGRDDDTGLSPEKRINEKGISAAQTGVVTDAETDDDDAGDTAPPVVYPDGGWRAWLVVAGVLLSQTCSFGYTNAFGVYNDYYVRYYLTTYSAGQISWIGSVQLGLVLSFGLVSGRAFDRGYFYHLMIGGSILLVFCLFMLSLTQSEQFYQIFLVQGIGLGIANGMLYVPAIGVISQYFLKHRALAIGIGTCGSGLGGALHPIMLNKLFHGPVGFKNGIRISAGFVAALLLISLVLMKPRPQPQNVGGGGGGTKSLNRQPTFWQKAKTFARDTPYVLSVTGTVFVLCGLYFPIYFVQLNSIKNGINPELAFYTIAILNGASTIGRILPNALIPKCGAFNILVASVATGALLVWCTPAVNNAAGTIVYCMVYGFCAGAYTSALPAAIASLARSDDEIGSRLGLTFTFTGIGGLLGTPIAGMLLTAHFHWWRPAVFAGSCVTVAACLFACSQMIKAREKGTYRV